MAQSKASWGWVRKGWPGHYADRAWIPEELWWARADVFDILDWGRYYPETSRRATYHYTPDCYPEWDSRHFTDGGG